MGPGSGNPGYGRREVTVIVTTLASMGPGSGNPGYGHAGLPMGEDRLVLQWVQGRVILVMGGDYNFKHGWCEQLQWVQGRVTLVMGRTALASGLRARCFNGSRVG